MADNLLQLFWDLSAENEGERVASANTLVKTLANVQDCPQSYDDFTELKYCVDRLVKGLASNRKGVRHSYFITLVEILKEFPVPFPELFILIKESLERVGNAKAQEERGMYFGRLFAYLAIIESGKLENEGDIKHLTKSLTHVSDKKSKLQEFCSVILDRLIAAVSCESVCRSVLPHLGLDCGWEKCSPGKLYLLLEVLDKCEGNKRLNEFLLLNWSCTELISKETLNQLPNILLTSSHSHPRLHVVWPLIIKRLRGGPLWKDFWNTVVNDSLMVSSRERKYLCYKLIEELILPSLELEEIDVVFSPRLIHQLETNCSQNHHLLHKAAKLFLEQIPGSVVIGGGVSVALPLQLIRYKTTTKVFNNVITSLLNKASVEDVDNYIDFLINIRWAELVKEKHSWMNEEISMLFKYLGTSLKRSRSWLIKLAQFLLLQSHSNTLKPSSESVPVPASDEAEYIEKLSTTLSYLSDLKCVRTSHDSSSGLPCDYWPVSLVLHVEELNKKGDINIDIDQELWDNAIDVTTELSQKEVQSRDDIDNALLYLLSVCLLDVIRNEKRATGNVQEILACYKTRITALKKTPKRRKSVACPAKPSTDYVSVMMDLILGLLSIPDQYWRNVSERAFLWLKGSLTSEAVEVIIKAIQPQGMDEVMEREDEDDVGNGEDIDAIGSDATNESDVDDDDSNDDDFHSSDDSSDNDDQTAHVFQDIGAEFRASVKNALGHLAAIDSDQETITSMDEENMEVVDSALTAAFLKQKEKLLEKKQKKTDKTSVMHFKMRVLELIELYIRHQSSNPLMLEFLEPLLSLVFKYNSHKIYAPLSERCRSLLEKYCRVKSYPKEGVNTEILHTILQQLITKRLYSAQRLTPVICQCAMFLLRVLKGIQKQPTISPIATRSTRKRRNIEKEVLNQKSSNFGALKVDYVIEWSSTALTDMITDKNCNVQALFFSTLSDRQPEIAWKLLPTLAVCLKKSSNHYRKIQGYTVLKAILGNYRQLSDEKVVAMLTPIIKDLMKVMSQELLDLSISSSKISHYLPIVEAFSDTVLVTQSYDDVYELIDIPMVLQVGTHLRSFNDVKVTNLVTSLAEDENNDANYNAKRVKTNVII